MSFTIGKLAQLSGFTPTLIRKWEHRHALLEPTRLENGHRRYTLEDLTVLRSIRALLEQGLRIGDIARLGRDQLARRSVAEPVASAVERLRVPPPDDDYLDARPPELAWSILDALPCAVIVTDRQGRIRWVNRGVPVLCGYDLAELHGLKPGDVLQGPDTDPEAVEQLRAAVANHRPCAVPIVNYHKSGEPYAALVELTPLGFGVNHRGFVGTARRIASSGVATNAMAER